MSAPAVTPRIAACVWLAVGRKAAEAMMTDLTLASMLLVSQEIIYGG